MTECTTSSQKFQADIFGNLGRRKIRFDFNGGNVSSDGGVLLLRQVDRRLRLTERVSRIFTEHDRRRPGSIRHGARSMVAQRIFGIACGYEDLNDHDTLRHDIAWQTAAGRSDTLASTPTLWRFENLADKRLCMALMKLQIEMFVESFESAPEKVVLDFDNTDDPVHGNQEGRFFNGYYDEYCFLPLYVFSGEKLVCSLLQTSNRDGAKYAGAVLKMITRKLREKWPGVKIIYRGDSGFARKRHLYWCERNNVDYIIGISKNNRLVSEIFGDLCDAESEYARTGKKVKKYRRFEYSADSWHGIKRDVIGKAEYGEHGGNPRFILTTLPGDPRHLYEDVHCARGNMENRIKEQQLYLFADRTSARKWWSNQLRLQLSSFAYVLFERMRNRALKGTELARAQVSTIRLKLLKIGAVIRRNTRSIYFSLSSACPHKEVFTRVADVFAPG